MTNNNHTHDPELLEQVEQLLHTGQATRNELLNNLAGTIPQARPEFQQTLESELLAALVRQSMNSEDNRLTMHANLTHDLTEKSRLKRAIPFTLVAALVALMMAALLLMNPFTPEQPDISGAANPNATASPIPRITLAPTHTPVPTLVPAVGNSSVQCPQSAIPIRAEPNELATPTAAILVDDNLRIEGLLTLNTGQSWYLVNREQARGWVAAAGMSVPCINTLAPEGVVLISSESLVELDVEPIATLVASPTLTPTFTSSPSPTQSPVPTRTPTVTPTPTSRNDVLAVTATAISQNSVDAFRPTVVPLDAFALTATRIIEGATAKVMTPTPTSLPVVVEQLAGGDFQITLPITLFADDTLRPGAVVNVLAEFTYSVDDQIWAQVAAALTVVEMNAMTDSPLSSFAVMQVTLRTADFNSIEILRNLAEEGVPFGLNPAN